MPNLETQNVNEPSKRHKQLLVRFVTQTRAFHFTAFITRPLIRNQDPCDLTANLKTLLVMVLEHAHKQARCVVCALGRGFERGDRSRATEMEKPRPLTLGEQRLPRP